MSATAQSTASGKAALDAVRSQLLGVLKSPATKIAILLRKRAVQKTCAPQSAGKRLGMSLVATRNDQSTAENTPANLHTGFVAWRCSLMPASARYAGIVRELAIAAAAVAKKKPVRPASAVMSMLAGLGGDWSRLQANTRETLVRAYDRLGLKLAASELVRLSIPAPKEGDVAEDRQSALARYLAPPELAYQADEVFENGVDAFKAEKWDEALRCFRQACKLYTTLSGLHEIHAADCLLNMSVAATYTGNSEKTRIWVAKAQYLYERWARLADVAKAMLNRVGFLCQEERYRDALEQAKKGGAVALRAGLVTAAVDARVVRLALEAVVAPRRGIVEEIDRLQRHFGEKCDPFRKQSFERCRALAKQKLELALARQMVVLIFRQAVRNGIPKDFQPLKKVLQNHPEAAIVLLETSFLELPAKAWPVLAEAAGRIVGWLGDGSIQSPTVAHLKKADTNGGSKRRQNPRSNGLATICTSDWMLGRLRALKDMLGMWIADSAPTTRQMHKWRPSFLASPLAGRAVAGCRPRAVSLDAARLMATAAGNWAEAWLDEQDELNLLGWLFVLAAMRMASSRQATLARGLLEAAEDCSPAIPALVRSIESNGKDDAPRVLARILEQCQKRGVFVSLPR